MNVESKGLIANGARKRRGLVCPSTPFNRPLHKLCTRLQRLAPQVYWLCIGVAFLVIGTVLGIVLQQNVKVQHIYCTRDPYFTSSQEQIRCEAWALLQTSQLARTAELQLPAECKGIPYLSQIMTDLGPWAEGGISVAALGAAAAKGGAMRLAIMDGRLFSYQDYSSTDLHARARYYIEFLQKMLCKFGDTAGQLAVDFVVNLKDECVSPVSEELALPMMGAQKSAMFHDILFPFPEFYRHWDEIVQKMRRAAKQWEDKKDLLVWRGTQTGGNYTADNWRQYPRSKLVLLCKDNPTLCDAAWSGWSQVDSSARKAIQQALGRSLGTFISLEDQQQYRYVASLDGNGWATRFAPLLASSSAVFKQTSWWTEFFYSAVRPYEHYIPLSHSLDDVQSTLRWARENEAAVRQIVANANAFVERWLSTECLHCYTLALLNEYQALQRYNVTAEGAVELPFACHEP